MRSAFAARHAPRRDERIERAAVHQLHGEETAAVRLLHREDGDDVGVVEGRQRLGLALETGHALRVVGKFGRQHLERHLPSQGRVASAVHDSHSTDPDLLQDLVVGEDLADHRSLAPGEYLLACTASARQRRSCMLRSPDRTGSGRQPCLLSLHEGGCRPSRCAQGITGCGGKGQVLNHSQIRSTASSGPGQKASRKVSLRSLSPMTRSAASRASEPSKFT